MKEKKEKHSLIKRLLGFIERVKRDHIGAYAAQSAYFLIMSFIPFVLFLTTLIRYTPLTYNTMRDAIIGFVPQNLQSFVLDIVADVYRRSSAIVPISAVIALWSAGKGLQSMTNGLNTIYHVKETRNWLITRIYAVFYTLLFVIALIVSLILLVLGTAFSQWLQSTCLFWDGLSQEFWGQEHFLCSAFCSLCSLFFTRCFQTEKLRLKVRFREPLLQLLPGLLFPTFFLCILRFFPVSVIHMEILPL